MSSWHHVNWGERQGWHVTAGVRGHHTWRVPRKGWGGGRVYVGGKEWAVHGA